MSRLRVKRAAAGIALSCAISAVAACAGTAAANAASSNDGSAVTVDVQSSITVTSDDVALVIQPAFASVSDIKYAWASQLVRVVTNSANGYQLSISADPGHAGQTVMAAAGSTTDSILSSTATVASPAPLAANAATWGFRAANWSGSSPTAATALVGSSSNAYQWAGLTGAVQTVRSVSSKAVTDTTMWFGVGVTPDLDPDTYTAYVLYTAVSS